MVTSSPPCLPPLYRSYRITFKAKSNVFEKEELGGGRIKVRVTFFKAGFYVFKAF